MLQIYGAGFVRNIVVGKEYVGEGLSEQGEYNKQRYWGGKPLHATLIVHTVTEMLLIKTNILI